MKIVIAAIFAIAMYSLLMYFREAVLGNKVYTWSDLFEMMKLHTNELRAVLYKSYQVVINIVGTVYSWIHNILQSSVIQKPYEWISELVLFSVAKLHDMMSGE